MKQYLEESKKYKNYHYSELEPIMLEYLHNKTLEMLNVVVDIFDENGIQYFICGGTMLGAETRGGFIPWDDDVDICVVEDDYKNMIDLLDNNVPSWMSVQWYNSEEHYYHAWVKVRDRNSHVFPDVGVYRENGVWIDIYKLKKVRRNEIPVLIAKEHLDYLNRRYSVGDITEADRDNRIASNHLIERINEHENMLADEDYVENEVYIIWSASKISLEVEWVFPGKEYVFEGLKLYGFNDAEMYLKQHYGEQFRCLPPNKLRRISINRIKTNIINEKVDA